MYLQVCPPEGHQRELPLKNHIFGHECRDWRCMRQSQRVTESKTILKSRSPPPSLEYQRTQALNSKGFLEGSPECCQVHMLYMIWRECCQGQQQVTRGCGRLASSLLCPSPRCPLPFLFRPKCTLPELFMDMHATPLPTLFLSSFPLLLFTFQVLFQKLLPPGSLPDVSSCPSGQMCLCTSGVSFLSPTLCPWMEVLLAHLPPTRSVAS